MDKRDKERPIRAADLLAGAAGGFAATLPMTLAMTALHARLPPDRRQPLPPRPLTRQVLRRVHLPWPEAEQLRKGLTLGAHFGFGAVAGAGYPALRRVLGPGVGTGMLHGMAVWAGSYLGWVPAARMLPPATRHAPERVALMVAAHLVWGATTALISDALSAPEESG